MKKLNALILLGVVSHLAFATADDNDVRKRLIDGFYMRLNAVTENCDSMDFPERFMRDEQTILNQLTPADIQRLLMQKNKQEKTLSETARSKGPSAACRILAIEFENLHRKADLKEYERIHILK